VGWTGKSSEEVVMRKGQKVIVNATVDSRYGVHNPDVLELVHCPEGLEPGVNIKSLFRWKKTKPWLGVVVGRSYRATGIYRAEPDSEFYDPYRDRALDEDVRHVVWMLEPLEGWRYLKPVPCLEKDLCTEWIQLRWEEGGVSIDESSYDAMFEQWLMEEPESYFDGFFDEFNPKDDDVLVALWPTTTQATRAGWVGTEYWDPGECWIEPVGDPIVLEEHYAKERNPAS
jgi:hypothetical protein